MRIAIDARLWAEPRSGIGRYTRSLTRAPPAGSPRRSAGSSTSIALRARPPPGVEVRCLPSPRRLIWSLWHAPRDLRRRPVDVFHGVTGFELPAARRRGARHDGARPRAAPAARAWCRRGIAGPSGASSRARSAGRAGSSPCRNARGPSSSRATACPRRASWWCPRRRRRTSRPRGPGPWPRSADALRPRPTRTSCSSASSSRRRTWARSSRPSPASAAGGAWGATELVVVGRPRLGPGPGAGGPGAGPRRRGPVRGAGAGRRPARPLRGRARLRVPLALGGLRAARSSRRWRPARPVVASDRGALPEVTAGAALLVEPDAGAAGGGARARSSPTPRCGSGCARRAWRGRAEFSWERTARETLAVYRAAARMSAPVGATERIARNAALKVAGPGDAACLARPRHRHGAGPRPGRVRQVHLRATRWPRCWASRWSSGSRRSSRGRSRGTRRRPRPSGRRRRP